MAYSFTDKSAIFISKEEKYVPYIRVLAWIRGASLLVLPNLSVVSLIGAFFITKRMSKPTFINSKVVYHDNSREYHIDARGKDLAAIIRACQTEDITPGASSRQTEEVRDRSAEEGILDIPDSIIFTKKAKQEGKIPAIVQALQKSIIGRKDKTRALVRELQSWQNDNYIDPQYNAQVMYDELQKILPLPFGYDAFKRLYNNTRP